MSDNPLNLLNNLKVSPIERFLEKYENLYDAASFLISIVAEDIEKIEIFNEIDQDIITFEDKTLFLSVLYSTLETLKETKEMDFRLDYTYEEVTNLANKDQYLLLYFWLHEVIKYLAYREMIVLKSYTGEDIAFDGDPVLLEEQWLMLAETWSRKRLLTIPLLNVGSSQLELLASFLRDSFIIKELTDNYINEYIGNENIPVESIDIGVLRKFRETASNFYYNEPSEDILELRDEVEIDIEDLSKIFLILSEEYSKEHLLELIKYFTSSLLFISIDDKLKTNLDIKTLVVALEASKESAAMFVLTHADEAVDSSFRLFKEEDINSPSSIKWIEEPSTFFNSLISILEEQSAERNYEKRAASIVEELIKEHGLNTDKEEDND